MVQLLTSRILSDIEGFVFLKKKQLGRKSRHYVRIHGGVLSVHNSPKSAVSWDANLIGCEVRSLRRRSFTIGLASGLSLFITLAAPAADDAQPWAAVLRASATRRLENQYQVCEKVGEGAFATVHRARDKTTDEIVAVKTIVKRQFDTTMARELDREVLACGQLHVPGIIRTREVYNAQDKVHLVMDLMPGGTLKDRVQSVGGCVPEAVAAPIVADTLRALAHMHRIGVAHRDVKLENVLCETPTLPTARTLLCDFGYVNFLEPGAETMRSLVGTPVYVAPEIVDRRSYGTAVDVWATGIMAYRMMGGTYPFDGGKDDEKTMELIAAGDLKFSDAPWKKVSSECLSFLRALLHPNPTIRLSAEGALYHPWLASHEPTEPVEAAGSPVSSATSPQSETSNAAAALASHAAKTDEDSAHVIAKKREVETLGDHLAEIVAGRPSGTHGSGDQQRFLQGDLPDCHGGGGGRGGGRGGVTCRTKFRLVVCMIVFRTRLQLAARLRRPLPPPPKGPPIAIASTVHPSQFVDDDPMKQEADSSLISGTSFGQISPAAMTFSPVGDKHLDTDFVPAQTDPLPDRVEQNTSAKPTGDVADAAQETNRTASIRRTSIFRTLSVGARANSMGQRENSRNPTARFDILKRFMSISIGSPRAQPPAAVPAN